jgi:hypothetical protein
MASIEGDHRIVVSRLRIFSRTLVAVVASVMAACTTGPHENADPAIAAREKRDAQMIKKMQSYVGWNIGSFMSDWGMTPTSTTPVADGNVYLFDKQQTESTCSWAIRTNNMGNIVQWSMRGNACPNADGP